MTTERRFKRLHLTTSGLSVMVVRDVTQGGRVVSFATGFVSGDTMVSAWCGTGEGCAGGVQASFMGPGCSVVQAGIDAPPLPGADYTHPLSRSCSAYIWTQYEMLKVAIADPRVRWLDLGAQHGTMKRGIGAHAHAVAGYLRCWGKTHKKLVSLLMKKMFDPKAHLNDP